MEEGNSMVSEDITEIKQRFNQEWLLIEVTKTDEVDQPVEGCLLAHSSDHDELWRMSEEFEGDLFIVFSGPVPEGVTFAL
jgi:hypothetical protein